MRVVYSLMGGDVEEHVGVLRGGVFRAMGRWEAQDQHHGLPAEVLLRLAEEGNRVVGNQVWIIVLQHRETWNEFVSGKSGNSEGNNQCDFHTFWIRRRLNLRSRTTHL